MEIDKRTQINQQLELVERSKLVSSYPWKLIAMFSIDGSNGRERCNLLQDKSEPLSSYNLFTIKTKRYKLSDK